MCLIFFSLQQHSHYQLVIAANRDEFYNRKTEAAHYWKDYPEILGGRDLEANGTWMAMTRSGKISMLTNYRDLSSINSNAPSRGHLVSDFLIEKTTAEHYLQKVATRGKEYNGFNLIVGGPDQLWYYSNYGAGVQQIKPGMHGLSNHLLDSPWPKVVRGNQKFKAVMDQQTIHPDDLFAMLYDHQIAPDDQLPSTGLPLDRERALSSMFIKTENYGSRCSTVVLIDHHNHAVFCERVYDLKTFDYTNRIFEFDIEPSTK